MASFPATFHQQKEQVVKLFEKALILAQTRRHKETETRLRESLEYLLAGKLYVVICGEFKQGKSSLIGALLEEPDLLPVDIDVATSLVSQISYGPTEQIQVVLGEHGREMGKNIFRDEIKSYVTEQGNPNNVRQARLMTILTPNPKLKDGMIVVDTPGVGGINIRHTDVTYAFVPNADAVLFVSDSLRPFTDPELDFVKMIGRHCSDILFVQTKIDAAHNYAEVLANNRAKLSEILSCKETSLQIIPVSSKLKLQFLKMNNPEDLEDSNFVELEQAIWHLLNERRGLILLTRALVELGRAVSELRIPLQADWDACRETDTAALDRMKREYEEAGTRLNTLLENNADWKTALSRGLIDVRTDVANSLQDGFKSIHTLCDQYVEEPRFAENRIQIASLLETDIDSLMTETGNRIGTLAADLTAKIESEAGINLNPFQAVPLTWRGGDLTDSTTSKVSRFDKTLDVVRFGGMRVPSGSMIGGAAGGLLGATVGLLIGGPIGMVAGWGHGAAIGAGFGTVGGISIGVKEGLGHLDARDKAEAKRILRQFIEEGRTVCSRTVTEIVNQLTRSMEDDLTKRIKQELGASREALESVKNRRLLTEKEAAARAGELEVPLSRLKDVLALAMSYTEALSEQHSAAIERLIKRPTAPATKVNDGLSAPEETPTAAPAGREDWADA